MLEVAGEILEEGRVRTRGRYLEKVIGKTLPSRMALEVRTQSSWVSRLLSQLGDEVIIANGRKLSLIFKNPKKQDRVDAEYLARLARVDLEVGTRNSGPSLTLRALFTASSLMKFHIQ